MHRSQSDGVLISIAFSPLKFKQFEGLLIVSMCPHGGYVLHKPIYKARTFNERMYLITTIDIESNQHYSKFDSLEKDLHFYKL